MYLPFSGVLELSLKIQMCFILGHSGGGTQGDFSGVSRDSKVRGLRDFERHFKEVLDDVCGISGSRMEFKKVSGSSTMSQRVSGAI